MTGNALKVIIALWALFFAGCGERHCKGETAKAGRNLEETFNSRFGIDYVFYNEPFYQREEWPRKLSETQAGWVNLASASWASIEPRPPSRGAHSYHWKKLDNAVMQWQKYGFNITISLRIMNGWFAGPIKYRPELDFKVPETFWNNTDRLPGSQDMPSYRSWIKALVERYDGDGRRDMPGLRYPVLHFQVGNEYSNPIFWTGTIEDYETLLKETFSAAKSASPDAKIISNGIRWNDLFHDDPEGVLFEMRFAEFLKRPSNAKIADIWERARAFTEKTVALAPYYDILDAGGNGPYPSASSGYMSWVRKELAKTKLKRIPWDMEARSEPQISIIETASFHLSLAVPGGKNILEAMKKKQNHAHKKAVEWYRAEQARILAQVFVTRFAAGFEKVFMGMPHDWDNTPAALTVSNPYLGLMDREGNPWAAFYALKLLVQHLDGFKNAEKLHFPKEVELYRFTFPGNSRVVHVTWLHEDKVRSMNDPLPSKKVCLKDFIKPAKIWEIPTTSRDGTFREHGGNPSGLTLDLTPTPLLIENQAQEQ